MAPKGSNKLSQQSNSGKAMAVSISHQSRTSYKNSGTALSRPVEQPKAYQKSTWVKHEDKQTGCYGRFTTKEKASAGERHVERGSGKVGVRDEFTKSSTVKVGNKSGYTEYHTEERVRDVKFDGSSTKAPRAIAYHDNGYGYSGGYSEDENASDADADDDHYLSDYVSGEDGDDNDENGGDEIADDNSIENVDDKPKVIYPLKFTPEIVLKNSSKDLKLFFTQAHLHSHLHPRAGNHFSMFSGHNFSRYIINDDNSVDEDYDNDDNHDDYDNDDYDDDDDDDGCDDDDY